MLRNLLVIIFCISALSVQAEIYKWVDEKGRVHYADKPPVDQLIHDNLTSNSESKSRKTLKISLPINASLPNSAILQLRVLFKQRQFHKMNDLLEAYQLQSEQDILTESRLFKTYSAFDLYDAFYESEFAAWIKLTPNNYQPYLARAKYYYSYGWKFRGGKYSNKTKSSQFSSMRRYFEKAKQDIAKVISLDNRSMVAYSLLIGMAKSQGDDVGANAAINQALKISPASFLVREHYINSLQPRWGGSYVEMQIFADAAQPYLAENKKLQQLKGFAILDAAAILSSADKYVEAEKLLNETLHYGENSRFLFLIGKNLYRQKKYDLALKYFERAIRVQPEDGDYYYWRSKTYTRLERNGSALSDIEKANVLILNNERIQKRHQWLASHVAIPGIKYKTKEQLSPELDKMVSLINQDPNNAFLYFKKGGMYLQKKDPQRALIDLKKAIELDPTNFDYYYLMDYALFQLNRLDDILQYWEKYLALKPNDSRAYLERAGTYYHKQDILLAMNDAKKALDLGDQKAEKFYLKLKGMLESAD